MPQCHQQLLQPKAGTSHVRRTSRMSLLAHLASVNRLRHRLMGSLRGEHHVQTAAVRWGNGGVCSMLQQFVASSIAVRALLGLRACIIPFASCISAGTAG